MQLSRYRIILITSFFIISLFSCSRIPDDQILIRYTISNPDYENINFSYHHVNGQASKTIPTLRDTVFTDTIISSEPLYISVSTNERFWIYGEPGKMIELALDTGSILNDQAIFSGDLITQNNYLKELESLHHKVNWEGGFGRSHKAEAFVALLDSVNDLKDKLLSGCKKTNPEHKFWADQREYIDIQTKSRSSSYVMFYYMNFQESLGDELRKKLSPDFTKYLDRPDLMKLPYLQYSMDDFIRSESARLSNIWWRENKDRKDDEGFIRPNFNEFGIHYLMDSVDNEQMRNNLMLILAKNGFRKGELLPIKGLLELFYNNCTNEEMIEIIEKEEAAWSILQEGEVAPEIFGFTPDGKQKKLSDYQGQYVFIDVWATWCGPCIGQFPSFGKLVEAYEDKNITFIMYSLDENRNDWLKFIAENDMHGIQLIGGQGYGDKFKDTYKFSGIPRQMLFNPEGKIIKTALERPSYLLKTGKLDTYLETN